MPNPYIKLRQDIVIDRLYAIYSRTITNNSVFNYEAYPFCELLYVEKGETLGDAMRQNPKIFPAILINMVDAGESSGSMDTSLFENGRGCQKCQP